MTRRQARRSRGVRVTVTDGRGRPARAPGLAAWLAAAAPREVHGAVAVALVSDATMRRLNARYRGVARATDVLSFPADRPGPGPAGAPEGDILGDVAIGLGVAGRQARDQGHSLARELRVLALHGLLHLLGYDHASDDGQMQRLEARLASRAGLPAGLTGRRVPR